MPSIKAQIIEIVNTIPIGKVMYFGQIGKLIVSQQTSESESKFVGVSGQVVGFMLSGLSEDQWSLLPWHRVVAKDGYISSLKLGAKGLIQKQLLLGEQVMIINDKVDMDRHLFATDNGEVLF